NTARTGVKTITLKTPLPPLTVAVTVDGTTQPGFAGKPLIELVGAGLTLTGGNSIVKSLAINSVPSPDGPLPTAKITIIGNGHNTIQGCYLGSNAAGTDKPTGQTATVGAGVLIQTSSDNVIGGTGTNQGNLISFNQEGIQFAGPCDANL